MRFLSRVLLLVFAAGLATGPIFAAPIAFSTAPTLTAPGSPGGSSGGLLRTLGSLGALVVGITISKDTGSLAKKFVTRATAAAGDYKEGVAGKGGEWEARTKEGESNYESGVQDAITRKAFGRGVAGSGSKYERNASTLGASRFGPGVANAQDAWARGVQPALDVLKSLTLPPKGPRRSPQNQARSNAVQLALGAMKK